MPADRPLLEQFRIEDARDGLIHLVFDMPGRTMNVFSNAAIHELGRFASWLKDADVRGVVVRSGKDNAFCAGADLGELGVAYDMIMATHPQDRFSVAFDHFFPLSHAIRKLETAGKPVAVALGGIALGGGCEFAMGGHYRVLVDDPKIGLGLPESLVGLLPGAGGTQRITRLVGVDLALDILLNGKRLSGRSALEAGLVDELAAAGDEIAAAERWLLTNPRPVQSWDEDNAARPTREELLSKIDQRRASVLIETLGHYPAPLAILDCIEFGLQQPIDAAIRAEMSIFSALIQRAEPRNMIQSLFLGKLDYERAMKKGVLPPAVSATIASLAVLTSEAKSAPGMAAAGFRPESQPFPVQHRVGEGYWIDRSREPGASDARKAIDQLVRRAGELADGLTLEQRRMIDYALITEAGFPAYLGGPFALLAQREPTDIRQGMKP